MRRLRNRSLAVLATLGALALTGCGSETYTPGGTAESSASGRTVTAREFMRLTSVHEGTGMTLLEGPVFGTDGELNVVDVTAPAGGPKVLRVDVRKKTVHKLFTDSRGAYTSAQFSPYDGRLYLTDISHGEIVSLAPDGSDRRAFFTGEVDGARMQPDDIAFDPDGHLYVSDALGMSEGRARGRVVRVDRDGAHATVLADGLAATNGISFDVDYRGLWISELTENRISYLPVEQRPGMASCGTRPSAWTAASRRPTRSPWTPTATCTRPCTAGPRWRCTAGTASASRRWRWRPAPKGWSRRRTWRSRPAVPRRT